MVARPFDTADRRVQGVRGGAGAGLHASQDAAEEDLRYRLDVVAADVVDVVRFAGGWLYDRAMAGWDVTVLIADRPDDRPLQILGVQVLDLEDALASVGTRPRPQALAAAADLFGCDSRVRQGVSSFAELSSFSSRRLGPGLTPGLPHNGEKTPPGIYPLVRGPLWIPLFVSACAAFSREERTKQGRNEDSAARSACAAES